MDQTPSTPKQASTPHRWYFRPWAISLWITLALAVIVFLVITYVPIGDPDSSGNGLNVSFHSGKIEAQNNLSTTSGISSSQYAQLAMQRIALINASDHPVMRKVWRKVADRLAGQTFLKTVDTFDLSDGEGWPTTGGRLYDMYIMLDMPRFDSSGLLVTGRTVDARVTVTIGQDLWDSRHGYTDNLSAPTVRINCRMKLEHHSVTTGYESANARYTLVIDNIAEQIGKSLVENLTKWSSGYGKLTSVPAGLYPEYRPVPTDLPLPENPTPVRVISGSGLLLHNHTVWTMKTNQPVQVLRDLHAALSGAGWRVPKRQFKDDDPWTHHLRASRDGNLYEAFAVRPNPLVTERPTDKPDRLVIIYKNRMTHEEAAPALERLLNADGVQIATLLTFERIMNAAQSDRLMQRLLSTDGLSSSAQMRVIRHLHKHGQAAEAIKRLRTAYIMALVNPDGNVNEVKELGREITEQDDWEPPQPTIEDLNKLGIKPLEPGKPSTAEVGLNEPAMFYQQLEGDDSYLGPLVLLSVTVKKSTIPEGVYELILAHRSPGGGGGSTTSTPHHPLSPWRHKDSYGCNKARWYAEAEEIGQDRFRIRISAKMISNN